MSKESILSDPYCGYLSVVRRGVRLYSGITEYSKGYYESEILYEKEKLDNALILTPLTPSTLTANSNIRMDPFVESELIKVLGKPTNNILKIGCNFGELLNESQMAELLTKAKKKRKVPKRKTNRSLNGIGEFKGRYFSSQITFFVKGSKVKSPLEYDEAFHLIAPFMDGGSALYSKEEQHDNVKTIAHEVLCFVGVLHKVKLYYNKNKRCVMHRKMDYGAMETKCSRCQMKVYQIKLFRNGNLQIPGVLSPTFDDIITPLFHIRDYIGSELQCNRLKVTYLVSEMRNYACRLSNLNCKIDLQKFRHALEQEKKNTLCSDEIINQDLFDKAPWFKSVHKYWKTYTPMQMAEINMNIEKCSALLIKFNRPSHLRPDKKVTIKVLKSGKLNFDGGFSDLEIKHLYYWIQNFFLDHMTDIIHSYDPMVDYDDDTSDYSGVSLYDDMLD